VKGSRLEVNLHLPLVRNRGVTDGPGTGGQAQCLVPPAAASSPRIGSAFLYA